MQSFYAIGEAVSKAADSKKSPSQRRRERVRGNHEKRMI